MAPSTREPLDNTVEWLSFFPGVVPRFSVVLVTFLGTEAGT